MYWNEKIDLVKKKYPYPAFKDPFREGGEIIEKVIRKFHDATYLTFTQSEEREYLLKDCMLMKETTVFDLYQNEMDKLDTNTNYWLFLINIPMDSGFKIYDCSKQALQYILYLSSGVNNPEFYIVDKKNNWIAYFTIDMNSDLVSIYKSGNTQTIFEQR